jgi:hypothetical protein
MEREADVTSTPVALLRVVSNARRAAMTAGGAEPSGALKVPLSLDATVKSTEDEGCTSAPVMDSPRSEASAGSGITRVLVPVPMLLCSLRLPLPLIQPTPSALGLVAPAGMNVNET